MRAHNRPIISFGFKKMMMLAVAASTALVLAACGGDGGTEPKSQVATEELVVTANPTVAKLLYGTSISYPNGIPEFGIDTAVTLTLSAYPSDTTKSAFVIKNGTDSVTGTITYGTTAKTSGVSSVTPWTFTPLISTVVNWLADPVTLGVQFQTVGLLGTVISNWTAAFSIRIGTFISDPFAFTNTICVGPYGTISISLTGTSVCNYDLGDVGTVDLSGIN